MGLRPKNRKSGSIYGQNDTFFARSAKKFYMLACTNGQKVMYNFFFGPKAHSGGPKAHNVPKNGKNVSIYGRNSTFWVRSAKQFYVLACTHGRRSVTGITGLGRRPKPETPTGAR